MKVITLMENEACGGLCAARGLSQYIETPKHKVLFDMGPDGGFLANAERLGVDLARVDVAVLSHGHSDHGGGLRAFCAVNSRAKIYLRPAALGAYYAVKPGEEPGYIGLDPAIRDLGDRLVLSEGGALDGELTLLTDIPNTFPLTPVAPKLQEKTEAGFRPDTFRHEQHLLVRAEGKAVLFAGCAHGGIVNIVRAAEAALGRRPDVVLGGFHLFELDPSDAESGHLLTATGEALAEGETVYYTGHCTGDYAYEALHAILGDRLRPMHGGTVTEI
jgi:7,8-dihydropterin-6-yl-methyl-4-(beta-D-ribofuranosyl)aminobenzene 5'-phosphate synthase